MLIAIFIAVVIVLIGVLVSQHLRHKADLSKAAGLLIDSYANYAALDQGMTELQESYEADELDWRDREAVHLQKIDILQGGLFDKETVINFLRVELADVKQSALEMQVQLDWHDKKCLPSLEQLFPRA